MKNKLKRIAFFLFTVLFTQSLWAQINVSGKVVDEKTKDAIIGASVIIKGTSKGAITDFDGNFELSAPQDAVLTVSYMGYSAQEVAVKGRTSLEILLKEDSEILQELVVVGYGVQRKSDLTGALSSIKMSDAIRTTPTSSMSNALQGRLAGVNIFSGSGQPGEGATIRIRGMNSIRADGGPLVVVDGLIGGSLESINPSDIQSVEVLKDASATAVYGSRAANGVILVTTRNPEVGKVTVSYNGYLNIKTPYTLPDVMSPGEFADLANKFGQEFYSTPREIYTADQVAAFKAGQGGYDYIDNIFREAALEQTHEVSISGGTDKVKFILSGNYNDNQGVVHNSFSQRANYRLKVDAEVKKWLKVGANLWGDWNSRQGPRFSQYNNLMIHGLTFSPTIEPKNESGDYNRVNVLNSSQMNPMVLVNEIDKDSYNYNSRLQGYVDVTLLKGLTFRMTHGFLFGNSNNFDTYGRGSYDYYQNNGSKSSASAQINTSYSWTNTNVLSYVKEFNKNHRINATAVFEQVLNKPMMVKGVGKGGLLSEFIGAYNVAYAMETVGSSSTTRNTMMSYLGRVNYVFMDRYMLTASWRQDGSSLLNYENRWDNFPALAVAWNIKEESFMAGLKDLSQMKLRLGYGVTGNQAVPIYSAWDKYLYKVSPSGGISLYIDNSNRGNKDLTWEITKQYNLGLDLGFFNNRLTFNIDAYKKDTDDVLLDVRVPLYTGSKTRLMNAGSIKNKGFEVTIGADPYVSKDFNWNTSVILSKNVTTVSRLANDEKEQTIGGNYEAGFYRHIVGEKIATLWGYKCLGVWTTDEINDLKASMSPGDFSKLNIEPGAYKYEDLDGVPGITKDDMQIIGNGQPTFSWSWNNTFNYKQFDFSFLLIGVHGFDIYNYTREAVIANNNNRLVPSYELLNRWTPANENAKIAGFGQLSNIQTPSSMFVEKGDFVKVKSITVGYTVPPSLLSKYDIGQVRVYASVQNPFLITDYSGMDPEVTLKTPMTSGIDYGYYPNGRNYMIGVNFQF